MSMCQDVRMSRCRDVCMYAGQRRERMTRQSKFNPHPKIKRSPPYNFLLVKGSPPPPSSQISANTNTNTASSQISVRGGTVICLFFTRPHQLEKARSVQILETAKHRSCGLGGTVPSQLFLACPQHFQPGTNNGINEGRHTSYL